MSVFSVLLPKFLEIEEASKAKIEDEFRKSLAIIETALEELKAKRRRHKEFKGSTESQNSQKSKNMTILKSINEDEADVIKLGSTSEGSSSQTSLESEVVKPKKRSKDEVDDLSSPETDKRPKRNASVKAQCIITKQVNVNLTQKLRREKSTDKARSNQMKDNDKENEKPFVPLIQIKQEKISLPLESMDTVSLTIDSDINKDQIPLSIQLKQEIITDEIAMPPPAAPVSKPRKTVKEKESKGDLSDEDTVVKKRTTRTKKNKDSEIMPPPPVAMSRATRASSRTTKNLETETAERASHASSQSTKNLEMETAEQATRTSSRATKNSETETAERATRASSRSTKNLESESQEPAPRPKRTRAKKKQESEVVKESIESQLNGSISSPAEKRPKRTRKAQKAAEKEAAQNNEVTESDPKKQNTTPSIQKPSKIPTPEYSKVPTSGGNNSPILQSLTVNSTFKSDLNKTNRLQRENSKDIKEKLTNMNQISKQHSKEKTKAEETKEKETLQEDPKQKSKEVSKQKSKADPKEKSKAYPKEKLNDDPKLRSKANSTEITKEDSEVKSNDDPKELLKENSKDAKEYPKEKSKKERKAVEKEIEMKEATQLDERKNLDGNAMNETMVLPKGVYNHDPVTPKAITRHLDETIVLEKCFNETVVLETIKQPISNTTVVIDNKDESLLTDDNSDSEVHTPQTPPLKDLPKPQPTSAVKERVQLFEDLASNRTRAETRALTKHISHSASKPRYNLPQSKPSTQSASKLSAINKAREEREELLKREKEDARQKKQALLEAKREQQKRKREEKMAAAAAMREAAEKERRLAMEAAARERTQKEKHADLGKMERLKETERRRQEAARKAAETEERRRAEEAARALKLTQEQRKAAAARDKQIREAEALKNEAVVMAKEIEKRQKEYLDKQKLKQKLKSVHTPTKNKSVPMEPVFMEYGFQYIVSDEEAENVPRPIPAWTTSASRNKVLPVINQVEVSYWDCLFSVCAQTPNLKEIFPYMGQHNLKRTSSAVWRTPPSNNHKLPTVRESPI